MIETIQTFWLSLDQIRELLTEGELTVSVNSGEAITVQLQINYGERLAAQKLAKKVK